MFDTVLTISGYLGAHTSLYSILDEKINSLLNFGNSLSNNIYQYLFIYIFTHNLLSQ